VFEQDQREFELPAAEAFAAVVDFAATWGYTIERSDRENQLAFSIRRGLRRSLVTVVFAGPAESSTVAVSGAHADVATAVFEALEDAEDEHALSQDARGKAEAVRTVDEAIEDAAAFSLDDFIVGHLLEAISHGRRLVREAVEGVGPINSS
jgi:hypothetical protein